MITYIYVLRSSCFCEIWALCVSWITYDQLWLMITYDILYILLVFLIYSHFFCSHHKQLNGELKHITFVMLAVNEQVALISSSYSETRLPRYIYEQFAMSLYLLCSTMLHLWLYYMQTTVLFKLKVKEFQYVIFQHLEVLHTLLMFHIYIPVFIWE